MIKIVCVKKPEVSYTLNVGQKYEVGRKQGNITFPDDSSISRSHGEIIVEHPIANITNVELTPNVCLTDLGSKFGTFVNEGIERKTALSMREKLNLSPGDRIKFGLQWNEFKIEYTPLITTTSAVKELQKLKGVISNLGGHLLPDWTNRCDFVIMESITLTIKAVCALLSAKRIVTPAYFSDLLECHVTGKSSFPNPSDFLPELAEQSLRAQALSFEPNPNRSKVFEEMIFMFVNQRHLRKLSAAIECGGGKCILIASATKKELISPKSLLMSLIIEDSALDHPTKEAIGIYRKAGKRAIPEAEIGMSALHCGTQKHCNPLYSMANAVRPPQKLISQTQASATSANSNPSFQPVPETQEVTQRSIISEHSIDVVEETMIEPTPKSEQRSKIHTSAVVSKDDENPGPSSVVRNSRKRQDDDVQENSLSKRRLPQAAETFLEPSIKKARKEPITSNKTLSNLFDSSSDEDESSVAVEEQKTEVPDLTESMDIVSGTIDDTDEVPSIVGLEASSASIPIPSTSMANKRINPSSLACDIEEDLFPTDASSVRGSSSVTTKRKLEEDEAPENRVKTRKVDNHKKEVIEEKLKKLDISKKVIVPKTENGNVLDNPEAILPCPTVFMKPILIERQSIDKVVMNNAGKNVINFKRFVKVTPLNASLRANSLPEENCSIRLVLDGDENCSFSSVPKRAEKDSATKVTNTDSENESHRELFEDASVTAPAAQPEPQPSTSRRATRSGALSPPKPINRKNKAQAETPVNESHSNVDFERHVEGGTGLRRSGRAGNVSASPPKPLRKQRQTEIQDMWTFQ